MENTALPPPAAPPRADFADWLSPMVVKELRQGVRTRTFVVVFILLQLSLLLDLSLSLLVAASNLDASQGTIFFWLLVSISVLVIVPLGGLNAIGSEIRANTLELIFLTHLTPFRIVLGKWSALFAQSLLLVCATLPYLVLRYFMGGVNVAGELSLLGTMLLGSALLTALTTGLSAYPVRLVRTVAVIGGLFLLVSGTGFFFAVVVTGRMGSVLPGGIGLVTTLLWTALLLLLLLDAGAARIAPPAENHTGFMRGLAVVGLGLAVAVSLVSGRSGGLAVGAFVVAAVVGAVAVCEQPRLITSLYRPFARRGWAGRIVGRFFYPGWPSGVMFTLAMFGAFGGLFAALGLFKDSDAIAHFAAALGTLMLPTALARTVFRRLNRPVVIFFLVGAASMVVLIFCSVCDSTLGTDLKIATAFLPPAALVAPWQSYGWRDQPWQWPVLAVTGLSTLVALGACVPAFRAVREMERVSLDLPDSPKNPLPEPAATPHVPLA